MSISTLIVMVVALGMVGISIRERVRLINYRDKDWDAIGESKSSPLSSALTNLVGMAGGIYLSMVLLLTFLEANIPESISLGSVSLEPLATVSIILAIVQPFVLNVVKMRKRF
ncbi:MAG: hypothetical protein FH756_02855 [Firmicutes bacterium]|nr:hypothetical protein [Bacillota bacterium]